MMPPYPFFSSSRSYQKEGPVWVGWGETLGTLAREEAAYHDHFDEDAIEVHQLRAPRNAYYHTRVWDMLYTVPKRGRILEVGAGSGFDAKELVESYELVLSDVSPKTLERLARRLGEENAIYVAADGEDLPFVDASFDAVYMVATWHHLEHPEAGLHEFFRVLKPGGQLVMAVEPNKTYFALIKLLRPLLIRLVRMKHVDVSHADEEMIGFSAAEVHKMLDRQGATHISIRPMWLFAGWLHYALEFFYRAFGLKKRATIPKIMERCIVFVDELLFRIPGVRHLGWHWIVSARKI